MVDLESGFLRNLEGIREETNWLTFLMVEGDSLGLSSPERGVGLVVFGLRADSLV